MSTRRFVILLVGLALLLLAAKSPLGGIAGFFAGVAIAFFVAGPAMLLGATQDTMTTILIALAVAWGAWVVVVGVQALRLVLAGDAAAARGKGAAALMMVAIPLALWISAQTLQEMWP
jgi:hypothetical protein